MEFEPETPSEEPDDHEDGGDDDRPRSGAMGCLSVFLKVVAALVVLLIVAVALVFGVCYFGSGNG